MSSFFMLKTSPAFVGFFVPDDLIRVADMAERVGVVPGRLESLDPG